MMEVIVNNGHIKRNEEAIKTAAQFLKEVEAGNVIDFACICLDKKGAPRVYFAASGKTNCYEMLGVLTAYQQDFLSIHNPHPTPKMEA